MTISAQRLTANDPARMESHPTRRSLAHPHCTLQELNPDDLEQTMCDAIHDDPEDLLVRTDPATFRLYVEFVHAHGLPKGEVTTFSNAGNVTSHAKDPFAR